MRQLVNVLFCLVFVVSAPISFADTAQQANTINKMDEKAQVQQAYHDWVKTVENAKGNATEVAALYEADAILLPTLSPEIKIKLSNDTSQELYDFTSRDIREYFVAFTSLKDLKATTSQLYTQLFNDVAVNTGLYTFEYVDNTGKKIDVPARFTFVYEKVNGKWLIINHHSSYLPEAK